MYNRSILAGYLTRDPELRYTSKGTPVAGFTVAANRSWTTESGERKDEATFVECSAWNRTAEVITQYFRKGTPILVEGDLRNNNWETESGEKRSKLYLNVDKFAFLQKKDGRELTSAQPTKAMATAGGGHGDDATDHVPF
jgi:single-strand DNA-binding protein